MSRTGPHRPGSGRVVVSSPTGIRQPRRPALSSTLRQHLRGVVDGLTVRIVPLSFVGNLDRGALLRATEALAPLMGSARLVESWGQESALAGMTIGGLTRHLVSQPECAVEFLQIQPPPSHAPVLSLAELYRRTDWFAARVDAAENKSICEDFNAMSAGGYEESRALLQRAAAALPGAVAAAGPTTYIPWQDCSVPTDDFLVVRLMEVVVHADDLAASLGEPTPQFDEEVIDPALALLGMLSGRQHGPLPALRTLSRAERATAPTPAFEPAGH
jgi:hypothetical protein